MVIDEDAAYRALQSRDSRFDGVFFVGVHTTGIYCRPSCPARTPYRENIDFYPSAAAAQRSGFRACKRCRPDATPGSAEWNVRADLAGRAVRLIADGLVDRSGVPGLARQLGYSERQVTRALVSELGAPPLALARAQRAQTARILLERTDLPASDVAFAAGFSSIRQFNDTVQQVFATTPTALRAAHRVGRSEPGILELRLPYRAPMELSATLEFLGKRSIAGIESTTDSSYTRAVRLPHGTGLISVTPGTDHVKAVLRLTDHRDLAAAVSRIRRLLDLDSDPIAVDETLSRQPALQPLVNKRPGLRSPGSIDAFEMAVRAVVGQQVSVSGARTVLARLTASYGDPAFPSAGTGASVAGLLDWPFAAGWRLFPTPERIAGLDPTDLPMPRARGRTIIALAAAFADGELVLDAGSDRASVRAQLLSMPGIGPWTADYLMLRVVGDPDVFLGTDLGVRHALATIGADSIDPLAAAPWRSYLTHHLWAHLGPASNNGMRLEK
jgi:AraC family transcriptional regulator, regulatory protein of adaptative response / DNA-3-methyladenine glycosylase II